MVIIKQRKESEKYDKKQIEKPKEDGTMKKELVKHVQNYSIVKITYPI